MAYSKIQIACPNCGHSFRVEEALENDLKTKLAQEAQEKVARQTEKLKEEREQLLRQQQAQPGLVKQKIKAELERARGQMQQDMHKQLLEQEKGITAKVHRLQNEKHALRFKEYEKRLEDQKKLIEEMKRKAEQGSTQMQGEVQELALTDLLGEQFAFDRIEEVAKGIRGADVIQTVINTLQQDCGKIIYESKRTKSFSNSWIEKLKADQLQQGADIAVIVTEAMPNGMQRFGPREGVWICSFQEIKGLSFVLREMLLRTYSLQATQENKGDKMEMLYRYLTSIEFKQRVEAIVEGFSELRSELDREKNAMQRIWKTRERQIEKIINNTIDMYGSVKGIGGSSVAAIPALELPED